MIKYILLFLLINVSLNSLADSYKFDYAVIDKEKVTTVNAPNITLDIKNDKVIVSYGNESIELKTTNGIDYRGNGQQGVVIVSTKVNGIFTRITIKAKVKEQAILLVYKRINE